VVAFYSVHAGNVVGLFVELVSEGTLPVQGLTNTPCRVEEEKNFLEASTDMCCYEDCDSEEDCLVL